MNIDHYTRHNGENFVHLSKIPESCKLKKCVLGIDEAGRGPVLGPMVYGIAYCPIDRNDDLKSLGVDDSKVLKESEREALFDKLLEDSAAEYVGWAIHVLSPRYISKSMYKRYKYNLNAMSHDTAIGLIHKAIAGGVRVAEVYVDTVGPPEVYQAKLEEIFPELKITVAKKADSLYPCVSAASICAKVARDKAISDWSFLEASPKQSFTKAWGSGYPADPVTKAFLQENLDSVFGYPNIVRFSWSTAEKILAQKAVKVEFEDPDEPDEDPQLANNPSIKQFFAPSSTLNKVASAQTGKIVKKRSLFFRDRKLVPANIKSFLD